MKRLLLAIKRAFRGAGIDRQGDAHATCAGTAEMRELQVKYDECRAAFDRLQSDATNFKQGYDGYRSAFEALQDETTGLRQRADGYEAAYVECCGRLAAARDERDRLLRSVEKLGRAKSTLPSR